MNILNLITPTDVGTKSQISFSANKRIYRADNPERKRVYEYHNLDQSEYFHNQPCVDYAMYLDKEKILYLIELKGSDITRAYQQVLETANKLFKKTDLDKGQVLGRIVLSRVRRPAVRTSKHKSLITKCAKLKLNMKEASQEMRETI